jgi:hypothetical protein
MPNIEIIEEKQNLREFKVTQGDQIRFVPIEVREDGLPSELVMQQACSGLRHDLKATSTTYFLGEYVTIEKHTAKGFPPTFECRDENDSPKSPSATFTLTKEKTKTEIGKMPETTNQGAIPINTESIAGLAVFAGVVAWNIFLNIKGRHIR